MGVRNSCNFIGNVGKIGMQYLPSGTAVTKFSLAVEKNKKNADGEWESDTTWLSCVAYGANAERLNATVGVGDTLAIASEFTSRAVEKDGTTHYYTDFVVDSWSRIKKSNRSTAEGGAPDEAAIEDEAPF